MLSIIASIIITTTVMTCHPISCEEAVDYHVPEWADVFTMAGILQGEVGNIPEAYDFVAEQLVADAMDYHVIGKPLISRWFAWKKPTPEATQAILSAWVRVAENGWNLTIPRCQYIGNKTDSATWGFKLEQADWTKTNGKWSVYAYNCN